MFSKCFVILFAEKHLLHPYKKGLPYLPSFRYLLVQVEEVKAAEVVQAELPAPASDQKTILTGIGGRDIKDKVTQFFTPNKVKAAPPAAAPSTSAPPAATLPPEDDPPGKNSDSLDWAGGYMPRGKAEISEACRQAFTATCHLLLECTTFPLYMSEEETMALHVEMFDQTGQCTTNDDVNVPYSVKLTSLAITSFISSSFVIFKSRDI